MENPESFAAYAGQVRFPRSADDLTSVRQCPACFVPLTTAVCVNCGLDLDHPVAAELAQKSAAVVSLLDERRELIGRMRFATAQAVEQQRAEASAAEEAAVAAALTAYEKKMADAAAAAPTTYAEPAFAAPPPIPSFAATPPAAASTPPAPVATTPRARNLSIQVLLLIAGVSLVSLAAVLFIIYAFVNFGIEWRSAIIAAVTVATFTTASLLRRRRYAATAEGIAVFAVVLVYLDAYAVRANNLFSSQGSDQQVYWGVTLLGSALGFILWRRLSGLRVASVAGFAAVAPGAALLLYGLSSQLDQPVRVFLSFAAMAVAGLLHPLAARTSRGATTASPGLPERSIVLSIAALGILVALVSAVFIDTSFWGATVAVAAVAVIGAAHALVSLTPGSTALRTTSAFGRGFAAVAAVAAASAFAATLPQRPEPAFAVIVPVVAAVFVGLALDTLWRRFASPAARGVAIAAAIGALIVAGVAVLVPVSFAVYLTFTTLFQSISVNAWTHDLTGQLVDPAAETAAAVAALAISVALAIGFSAASRTLRQRFVALVAVAASVMVLAVPLLETTWMVVAAWSTLGAVALVLVILSRARWQVGAALRRTLAGIAIVGISLGYIASWASVDSWFAGSVTTIVLVVAARWAFPPTSAGDRAGLLALGAFLAIIASIALAQQVTLGVRSGLDYSNSVRFVDIVAVALLALGSVSHALRLSPTDRRTVFWIAFPTAAVASLLVWLLGDASDLVLPEYGTSLVVSGVLVAGLVLWIVLRGNADVRGERMAASIALAPAGFLLVDAFARLTELPAFADLSAITSALLVAAGALVVSILRPSGTPRWSREVGIALVVVPSLYLAVRSPHDQTWLVLLLGGVTALLTAISADGLFGSDSGRKHFGWIALALGTAGLWWRLRTETVTDVEPYVLPVAGALLAIALLVWRAKREESLRTPSAAAPLIALGGLLVAVLPIAAAGGSGMLARAITIGAVSAALVLAGSLVRAGRSIQPYLDAAAFTGALGLLTVTIGRIALSIPLTDTRVDVWLGGAVVVLVAAAFGQALHRDPTYDEGSLRPIVSQLLAAVAVCTVLVVQLFALAATSEPTADVARLRVLCWAIAFAVVAIIASTVNRGPLRPAVGWTAVVALGLLVFGALTERSLTIFEASGLLVLIALASSATALAVTLLHPRAEPRFGREIGLAALGLTALVFLPAAYSDSSWLVLEVAAVGALLASISTDGLIASSSARKHVGWLALALAVGGLWWRLAGTEVRDVEPYVLPLAGALLLIALFSWRAQRSQPTGAAPLITLGALLIAILPLGLNGATGPIERPVAVGLASAALLLVGSLLRGPAKLRPYLNAAAAAGAVGVLVVAIGRSWFISAEAGSPAISLDAWLGATLVVVVVAAIAQSRTRVENRSGVRLALAKASVIAALAIVVAFEAAAMDDSDTGLARALSTVLLLCVVHVIAVLVDASPFTRAVRWTAFGLASITAAVGMTSRAFDEIELATVPLALALIAGGIVHLRREPQSRSWPHLGPGLLLLLLPPLLFAVEERPLWRVAAIAVVAIAITVVGLLLRLQAPFIIGALVTIVHTVTTFYPQLSELYELHSWLVWIIIGTLGGTLLIVLAARFEKSITTARSTLRRVGDLR